jgi:hypothetical protein
MSLGLNEIWTPGWIIVLVGLISWQHDEKYFPILGTDGLNVQEKPSGMVYFMYNYILATTYYLNPQLFTLTLVFKFVKGSNNSRKQ